MKIRPNETPKQGQIFVEELLSIFCDIDDFCIEYKKYFKTHLFMEVDEIILKTALSLSEIMTIVIYFHLLIYKTFKWYYLQLVCITLKLYFLEPVIYN